jgi:hypothetical protein
VPGGIGTEKRTGRNARVDAGRRRRSAATAAARTRVIAPIARSAGGVRRFGKGAAVIPEVSPVAGNCSWNARSCAEWKRASGSFSRQWWMIRSRAAGTCRFVDERSSGSSLRIADIVSAAVSRWNAFLPESIS